MKKLLLTAFVCSLGASEASAQLTNFPVPPCPPGGNALGCGGRQVSSAPLSGGSCPANRWVGYWIGPGTMVNCPTDSPSPSGDWSVQPLFNGATNPVLRNFCLYRWASRTGAPPDISVLPNIATFRVERDCRIVDALLEPTPVAAVLLEDAYDAQVSQPTFLPETIPPAISTRVAIVDTTPDETVSGLPSGLAGTHGRAMADLIAHNSCMRDTSGDEIGCTAFLTSYQGLGQGGNANEGSHGYPTEVANAIYRAIRDWKVSPHLNLIINLSIGWSDNQRSAYGENMSVTSASAYLAIQHAACEGALVVAAAGNRGRMNGATGPMFPAAFEVSERLCPGPENGYAPIIHAIGAVDGADRFLSIQREDGIPRLVAPSKMISVGGSTVLTGTSLSAAGVAGIAAMVWNHIPTMDASQVTDRIMQNATPLAGVPDFDYPPAVWTISRVASCAAIGIAAPTIMPCSVHTAYDDASPDYTAVSSDLFPGYLQGPDTNIKYLQLPTTPIIGYPEGTSRPYTTSQPQKPTCPGCQLNFNELVGKIEVTASDSIERIDLRILPCQIGYCSQTSGTIELAISDLSQPFKVTIPGLAEAGGATGAVMEISGRNNEGAYVRMTDVAVK